MLKIAFLYLGRKGAGPVYSFEMAKALSEKCKLLIVLSYFVENKPSWEKEAGRNPNIEVFFVPTYMTAFQCLLSFFRFGNFLRIVNKIRQFQPDVLYSTMSHFWDIILFPMVKCNCKVKTIHDSSLHDGEANLIFKFFHYFLFKQADKYVILSKSFKRDLVARGIDGNNIIVIPHAVFDYYKGLDTIKATEKPFQVYSKILFFGRIIKYKGLEVLLEAMEIVVKKLPDLMLVIAGDGDISPYLEKIRSLEANVELHFQWIADEDVGAFFSEIDFLVLPYTQASQSGVIPLAYGFSKPVIASSVGGIPEQVLDSRTGILVQPNDVKQLADAIVKLASDHILLKEMSNACQEYVKSELTWQSSAEKFLNGIRDYGA